MRHFSSLSLFSPLLLTIGCLDGGSSGDGNDPSDKSSTAMAGASSAVSEPDEKVEEPGKTDEETGSEEIPEEMPEDPPTESVPECKTGSYLDASSETCAAYTECQKGESVEKEGTETSDRGCAPCEEGTFSDSKNSESCRAITLCGEKEYETEEPTPKSDRVCAGCSDGFTDPELPLCAWVCEGGTWDDDADTSTACVAKSSCDPGEEVLSDRDSVTDRSCAPCESDEFSEDENQQECEAHSCPVGTEVFIGGTTTSDHTCLDCPAGEYDDDDDGLTACSACSAGQYCAGGASEPSECLLAGGSLDLDGDPSTPCDPLNYLGAVDTLPLTPESGDTVVWTPFDLTLLWDGESWVPTDEEDTPDKSVWGLPPSPEDGDMVYWTGLDLFCEYNGSTWDTLLLGEDAPVETCENDVLLVFATKNKTNGNLGGIAGGDQYCQDAAEAADLGGTWRAWLSDTTSTPADRFSTDASAEYRRLDGALFADDFDDLDVNVKVSMNITEYGETMAGSTADRYAWTGTQSNGTVATSHCNNWTVGSSGASGHHGRATATNFRWTLYGSTACFQAGNLICMQQY